MAHWESGEAASCEAQHTDSTPPLPLLRELAEQFGRHIRIPLFVVVVVLDEEPVAYCAETNDDRAVGTVPDLVAHRKPKKFALFT